MLRILGVVHFFLDGVILSGAVFQAQRRISRVSNTLARALVTLLASSLGPLEKTRAFG